jgi:Carboxypeptidase regulatory-like domain
MKGFWGAVLLAAAVLTPAGLAQTTGGDIVGEVFDHTGAVIPGAHIELKNQATGAQSITTSGAEGQYRFGNLLVGNYTLTASAERFAPSSLKGVQVQLNQTTTANLTLEVSQVATTVEVIEAAAPLDTTTSQITDSFSARLAEDLPLAANPVGGVLNLSLLSAGATSSGGIGQGTGPSFAGQRPRYNNFTIEGVDNNRKDVTGPAVTVPNDGVAEFSVLQNQFSAEFGHSAGGQLNTVIQDGTNALHGSLYEYFQNRNLNAVDQAFARQGVRTPPRFDSNRLGADVGGPIVRNKLFYYGLFEYNPTGEQTTTSSQIWAPTSAGYATLAATPGVSQTNLGVLKQFLSPAPAAEYTSTVNGVDIPVGPTSVAAPAYINAYNGLASIDYILSDRDELRGRYIGNRYSYIDSQASLPAFFLEQPTTAGLATLSEFHTFRAGLVNELRLAFNRFNYSVGVPNIQFPGLDAFPNIVIYELGVQLGPDPNAPQTEIQNTYQLADNMSWVKGRHELKFGIDVRDYIANSTFVQYQRGDYQYLNIEQYLLDYSPNYVDERSVGQALPYSGNAPAFYAFANDNWRVTSKLNVNLGLRWEYNGVSRSMQDQAMNSVSNVPGVLTFFAPKAQLTNFAPRVGFAYSPGSRANTVIRGGFGIAYDPIFDNIGENVRPPQASSLLQVSPYANIPDFLGSGGIPADLTPDNPRAATTGWLPNQKLGYALTWNLGVEHVFANDYTLEVRYIGTKGVHLPLQSQLNRNAAVTPASYLPTYLQMPSQATLDSLPLTLPQLQAVPINPLAPYGFTSPITSYLPIGNSIYHGLAAELKKRFSRRFLFDGTYTWSHALDDSTADVFTTALTPRRPQDFNNISSEWATSALDRRHRVTLTWLYETPWFASNQNVLLRNLLGNYQVAGTYLLESPEYVTPQSGVDSNLNRDSAADRTIVNPQGIPGTGSGVTALKNSAGATVAYLAANPAAQYIVAGPGALATAGRNTLPTSRINNWDMNVAKNFVIRERTRVQFRADFFNAFNHPQYVPGQINNVQTTFTKNAQTYLVPGKPLFAQWDQVFRSNSRDVQLALKISF